MLRLKISILIVVVLFVAGCSSGEHEHGSEWYNSPVLSSVFGDYEKADPVYIRDADSFARYRERGEYLVGAAKCGVCHEGEGGLSGGKYMRDEFGLVRAPNITPDVDTGIGQWNVAEVSRALRSSIDFLGRPIGISVHKDYAWMSDEDIRSISIAVLSRPAVENIVERRIIGGVQRNSWMLIPKHNDPKGYVTAMVPSNKPSYGRYLYHHVARCVVCHAEDASVLESGPTIKGTVSEVLGSLSSFAGLSSDSSIPTGDFVSFSPSVDLLRLSPDTFSDWDDKAWEKFFASGAHPGGGEIPASQCQAVGEGLNQRDKEALAAYIRDSINRHAS